ncbi:hypothetical protein F7725_003277 [Dissostichus mawsoni]|uniref:Ig-like domain-containing protein n=1 Tax=Dissostichus mawsoni TaxID=36200 RepID=A0A7J5YBR1_DISMA|nr:hypothetical protein F7725_003277 [Dissostichus mawsoni]
MEQPLISYNLMFCVMIWDYQSYYFFYSTLTILSAVAPEINEGTYSKDVKLDGNVTLDCSAEGNPLPDLHWNYTTAENVRETTRGHQKSLTITGATSTNAGVYICAATNNVGKVTSTVTLKMMKAKRSVLPLRFLWWLLIGLIVVVVVVVVIVIVIVHKRCKNMGDIVLSLTEPMIVQISQWILSLTGLKIQCNILLNG